MDYQSLFSADTKTMKSSLIRELVAQTKKVQDLISFAGGFPAPATFPKHILSDLYYSIVNDEGYEVLQYGASEGDSLLKDELIKWEGYKNLSPDEMLITVGATNGIYYYTKSLIDKGDVILCEAPSFLGSVVSFEAIGAEVIGIPMDNEGIDIDQLKNTINLVTKTGKKIKFLYTIPDFQNPSGVSMSLSRRIDLIDTCLKAGIMILEDNPYSRLRFVGKPLPTMYSLSKSDFNGSDIVTEIVSFSKILGPGMRLAFVKGSKTIIEKMGSWQQKINVSPDCVTERVAARFLEKGFMNPHISTICEYYRPYLKKMLDELSVHMPEGVTWAKPEGGIFLWLWLPENINADELFRTALEHKVTFIPGSKFYPSGQEVYNCLRLNYTYSTQNQIENGIGRLGEMLKSIIT